MNKIESKNIVTDYVVKPRQTVANIDANLMVTAPNVGENIPSTKTVEGVSSPLTIDSAKSSTINQINKVKEFLLTKNIDMNYTKDSESGVPMVQFLDNNTKEVIRQIPTEESLKIMKTIDMFLEQSRKGSVTGVFLNQKA